MGLGRGGLAKASSAADLQQAAHAMERESGGHCSNLTHKIARAGCYEKHKQNIQRDISSSRPLNLYPGAARLAEIRVQHEDLHSQGTLLVHRLPAGLD